MPASLTNSLKLAVVAAIAVAAADTLMVQWTGYAAPATFLAYAFAVTLLVFLLTGAAVALSVAALARLVGEAVYSRYGLGAAAGVVTFVAFHVARSASSGRSAASIAVLVSSLAFAGLALWMFRSSAITAGEGGGVAWHRAAVRAFGLASVVALFWSIYWRVGLPGGPRMRAIALQTGNATHLWRTVALFVLLNLALFAILRAAGSRKLLDTGRFGGVAATLVATLLTASVLTHPVAPGSSWQFVQVVDDEAASGDTVDRAGPDVFILVLDTVRAASLSVYGYERPTTPQLERFAQTAHTFEQGYSVGSWSLPGHAALLTGMLTHEHGAHRYAIPVDVDTAGAAIEARIEALPLSTDIDTLPEKFAQRGYGTAAIVANHGYFSPFYGLLQGFAYADNRPRNQAIIEPLAGPFSRKIGSFVESRYMVLSDPVRPAGTIVDDTLEWLDNHRDRPSFVLMNFMDGHGPYASADIWGPSDFITLDPPGPGVTRALDRYDRAIRYLDHELGRFFDALRERDLFDNSLIVITADHGETFIDNGERGVHGWGVAGTDVRVPFLVKQPHQNEGKRWQRAVSTASLSALSLATADAGAGAASRSAELLENELMNPLRPVIAELYMFGGRVDGPVTFASPEDLAERFPTLVALVEYPWKLIRGSDGNRRLYNLQSDPSEEHDVAAQHVDLAERLDALLLSQVPLSAIGPWIAQDPWTAPDEEVLSRLRALGYVR